MLPEFSILNKIVCREDIDYIIFHAILSMCCYFYKNRYRGKKIQYAFFFVINSIEEYIFFIVLLLLLVVSYSRTGEAFKTLLKTQSVKPPSI